MFKEQSFEQSFILHVRITCKMYLNLFIGLLCLCRMPTSAKHVCHFYNCFDTGHNPPCSSTHCYADIVCKEGRTINIGKVFYGTNKFFYSTDACKNVCYGDVAYNHTSTNGIRKLCNGLQKCSLRQWNTRTHWILDVIYECKETTTATTVTPTTSAKRVANYTADNSELSDKFLVTTAASSIATGIFVLVIVLIGVVCIKWRKANKKMTDNTHDQRNNRWAMTHNLYKERRASCYSTDSAKCKDHVYDYATAHIATTSRYENEYNTLNTTSKPLKGDQIYDHIPNELSTVN